MTPDIPDPDFPEPDDAAEVGDGAYDVGYCKPPVATRFKAGTSGNPRGRAKGSRNVATTLTRELNAVVTIQENGKRRQITKLEAILKQQVNQAASGDNRCAQFVLRQRTGSDLTPRDLCKKGKCVCCLCPRHCVVGTCMAPANTGHGVHVCVCACVRARVVTIR